MQKSTADVMAVKLDQFDVAELKFLQALLDTCAITRAGEHLEMSQPAASRMMLRLRNHFSDPLLVRTARGYVLTPVAELLRPRVRAALDSINALFEIATFDEKTSTRIFRIASTDYGISTVLLPKLSDLRIKAPLTSLQIDPWSDETIVRLERGELDCALYSDELLPTDFHYRTLFSDGYAFVCHHHHPLREHEQSTVKDLLKAAAQFPQFAPRYLTSRRYVTDDIYDRSGIQPACIAISTPYFHTALESIMSGDLVALIPERLARTWQQQHSVAVLPIQDKSRRFDYRLIWHERVHRDKGLLWLRGLLGGM